MFYYIGIFCVSAFAIRVLCNLAVLHANDKEKARQSASCPARTLLNLKSEPLNINNSNDSDNADLIRRAVENMRFVYDPPVRGDIFISPIWMQDPENHNEKIKIGSLYAESLNSPDVSAKIVSARPRGKVMPGPIWMESLDNPAKMTKLGEIEL